MFSGAELEMAYKVANANVKLFPYPHLYIENVFSENFYKDLQKNIPDPEAMIPIGEARPVKGYNERFVLEIAGKHLDRLPEDKRLFWKEMSEWMLSGRFMNLMLQKFGGYVQERYKGQPGVSFYNESLLVEDITKYSLGPHTDSPRKVITFLFYLPKDESQSHLGTSIYLPKDMSFTCPGGPHYKHEDFMRIATMPFKPNSLFAFVKTDNSFHGVEPISDPDTKRWLLLYDIYARLPEAQKAAPAAAGGNVSFKF